MINLHLMPWIVAFAVVAAVGVLLLVGVLAEGILRNRPVRKARGETVTRYYGHLILGH